MGLYNPIIKELGLAARFGSRDKEELSGLSTLHPFYFLFLIGFIFFYTELSSPSDQRGSPDPYPHSFTKKKKEHFIAISSLKNLCGGGTTCPARITCFSLD